MRNTHTTNLLQCFSQGLLAPGPAGGVEHGAGYCSSMVSSPGEWESDGGDSCAAANAFSGGNLGASCSSDSCADLACADSHVYRVKIGARLVAAPTSPWEFPLSAAEKQERVLLLYDKEASLANRQLRRSERVVAHLRAQVAALRGSQSRWHRERRTMRKEAAALHSENRRLHERVGDLLLQLQQQQQLQQLQEQEQQLQQRQQQQPPPVAQAPSVQLDLEQQPQRSSATPPEPVHAPSFSLPLAADQESATPSPCQAFSWRSARSARRSGSCGAVVARAPRMSLDSVLGGPGASRSSLRGTVAMVTWGEATGVPWLAFVSRASGLPRIYGNGREGAHEECMLSLRRGEYICSISGCHGRAPLLAQHVRVLTSEQQEVTAGAAGRLAAEALAGQESGTAGCSFSFTASDGHEIVGLKLGEDGRICGVKQVALPPSRVPLSAIMEPPGAASLHAKPPRLSAPCMNGSVRPSTASRTREALREVVT